MLFVCSLCTLHLFFCYSCVSFFIHSISEGGEEKMYGDQHPSFIVNVSPPFHSLSRCLLTLSVRTLSATESFPGERYFVVRTREKDYPPPTRTPKYNETTASPNTGEIIVLPPPNPHPPPPFTAGAAAKGQPLPLPVTWKGPPFPTSPHPASPPPPFPDHLAPTSFDLTPLKRKDGTSLQTEGSTGLTVFSGEHEESSYFPRQRVAPVTAAATWLVGYLGLS